MHTAILSPPPPSRAQILRLLGAAACCVGSVCAIACSPVPPEAAQLALASGSALDALRAEHTALVRAVSESRRIEIDAQFSSIYADAAAAVRARHNLPPDAPLSLEHRLDIAAITLSARDELLASIAQSEADLLARSDLHHAHARRMTDALSAYLLARTDSDDLRASLGRTLATRLGIDPANLDPSQALVDLLAPPTR